MFTVVPRPRDILAQLLIASMSTTEAIENEPQREATGTTAAPTPADHSTAYPAGGAPQKIKAVARPVFQAARSVKRHEHG